MAALDVCFFVICFTGLITRLSALECHQCSKAPSEEECNNSPTVTCAAGESCEMIVKTNSGGNFFTKGCYHKACKDKDTMLCSSGKATCRVCCDTGDLCNDDILSYKEQCPDGPCNNGTFLLQGTASYKCDCDPGYHGATCEESYGGTTPPSDCAVGWYRREDSCYKYMRTSVTFDQARALCAIEDAHLLTLDTVEEDEWLRESYLQRNLVDNDIFNGIPLWTAGKYMADAWYWVSTGEPIGAWLKFPYPYQTGNGLCLSYTTTLGFHSRGMATFDSCNANREIVCEMDLTPTPSSRKCRPGWYRHGDSCYRFSTSSVTFSVAIAACQADNAHLWTMETTEEEDYMRDTFIVPNVQPASGNSRMWIGGEYVAGAWQWITTQEPVCSCHQWGPRGLTATSTTTCLAYYTHATGTGFGDLEDADCNWKQPYLCEYEV